MLQSAQRRQDPAYNEKRYDAKARHASNCCTADCNDTNTLTPGETCDLRRTGVTGEASASVGMTRDAKTRLARASCVLRSRESLRRALACRGQHSGESTRSSLLRFASSRGVGKILMPPETTCVVQRLTVACAGERGLGVDRLGPQGTASGYCAAQRTVIYLFTPRTVVRDVPVRLAQVRLASVGEA